MGQFGERGSARQISFLPPIIDKMQWALARTGRDLYNGMRQDKRGENVSEFVTRLLQSAAVSGTLAKSKLAPATALVIGPKQPDGFSE
jgi:hypothetical protein